MIVVGTGGHAKEILEILLQQKKTTGLSFYDDVTPGLPKNLYREFPILRNLEEVKKHFKKDKRFVLGIGQPAARCSLERKFTQVGGILTSSISPTAIIGKMSVQLGAGLNVMTGVVITSNVAVGRGTLLNTYSSVHHDVTVGEFCEISPSVRLLGGSQVGNFCRIGTSAIILPKVKIGNNVTVGAGTIVIDDVDDNSLVVGAPHRLVKKLPEIFASED